MEDAVFVNDVPLRITEQDVIRWHLASFPSLIDDENKGIVNEAINAVYTMFSGSQTLFSHNEKQIYYDKTRLLFRLLTCWYIADQYPLLVSGSPIMGGLPLKEKKIGPVTLKFQDQFTKGQNPEYQDLLAGLKSNSWGNKAYFMIRAASKRLMIWGGTKKGV